MRTRFYIWVTSDCNLSCKWCIQRYTMDQNKGYSMQRDEIDYIVDSCKSRSIHFNIIELTGGEVSLWEHLEYGVQKFSEICNYVTLATNGNNPERIIALDLKTWIVSASQATPEQLNKYEKVKDKIAFNYHKHKKMPDHAVVNSLPSRCCTSTDSFKVRQTTMEYIRGKVWYCPDAFAHTEKTGVYPEIVFDFKRDFINKFSRKRYNQKICQYCLGNGNIWNTMIERGEDEMTNFII